MLSTWLKQMLKVDEDTMLNAALMFGHEAIKELIAFERKSC